MEEEVSIKVKVADRIIPIKVLASEEQNVRKAVKDLDTKIKKYRNDYQRNDYKDILAMLVLEYAVKNTVFESKDWIEDEGITDQIDEIDSLLDSYITS